MTTKLENEIFFHRTNRNQQIITAARSKCRELLMDLLEVHYTHPTYLNQRKNYFDAVQEYADLTDQTFENAIGNVL